MKQLAFGLILVSGAATAECVLQDRVVNRSEVVIAERSAITRDVVPYFDKKRKCVVDFRARIGNEWHTAFGEHVWSGDRPVTEACAIAVKNAEDSLRERVGKTQTVNERILVCRDDDRLKYHATPQIGTVGEIAQFRPHPERPRSFWHNGTQCRWFLDTAFTGRDVRTFQGIICQTSAHKWVVVDKF